jgi:O-succinylbenzoic acid--CoA ligase
VTGLVALDLPGGAAFVSALEQAWSDGDAVLVVDQRLPAVAKATLVAQAGAQRVVWADGSERLDGARTALEPGDALVVASSGSTGSPKLLVHTAGSLLAHARAVHRRLAVGSGDRWLACLPLNHLGGFGVVARSLLDEVGLDVLAGFDREAVAAAPERLGSTLVSLVPTTLDRIDGDRFRVVVLGGSADAGGRPANVVRTYGLTESGGGVVYDGIPLDGVEVRVDADGQIWLRSPTMARGRLTATGTVEPLVDGDGWMATGDLGAWHDGRLAVHGRADDLIVTGGENVWPAPVERLLGTLPSVADVAIVGAPDPTWGTRVVALVVPADPDRPPTLTELRDHVAATLAPAHAPRELRLVDELPRTALGKLARRTLLPPPEAGPGPVAGGVARGAEAQ